MIIRKSALALLTIVFASSLAVIAWAGPQNLQFMALKASPSASGAIKLADNEINIEAKGLKANSVYTVWFVNKMPKMEQAGAGEPPYMFKTDSSGKGTYDSRLVESPFGKWGMIMVVIHPSGDSKDMKNIVPAFSATIPHSSK